MTPKGPLSPMSLAKFAASSGKFSNITIVINMHQAFNGHWLLLRILCTLSHLIHMELGNWRRVTSRHETANLTKAGLQG